MGEQPSLPLEPLKDRGSPPVPPKQPSRRLRILSLHGFRQSASGFEGRTHALRRRLKDLADFVFFDAPHELPVWGGQHEKVPELAGPGHNAQPAETVRPVAGWPQQAQQDHTPAAKRAWLLVPEQYAALHQPAAACSSSSSSSSSSNGGSTAPFATDPAQYEQQTAGWQESLATVQHALAELGPFDGVLGLSQGAAVAAVLVALQWQAQQAQQAQQQQAQPAGSRCGGSGSSGQRAACPLKFAVLCSGYCSRVPEHTQLLSEAAAAGGVPLPSLHMFGGGEGDRQISTEESAALAACFQAEQRSEVRHGAGHLIPSSGEALNALREFLLRQQLCLRASAAATPAV